ncbi:MAG: tetratricopeptide repeat protein [Candidatus Eisenbacteria bacterium]|nr:tetratricopeptide repeat protein [Candidatus Eisenbacteria bacterium]
MKIARFAFAGCLISLMVFLLSGCGNPHLSGGRLYFAQKNYEKAIRELELAAQQLPKNADVHMNLAMSYAEVGRTADSGKEFAIALKLMVRGSKGYKDCKDNQRHYWAEHFNKGLELQQDDRFDESAAEFQKALDIDPMEPAAYVNRGVVLSKLNRMDDAIKSFKNAFKLAPNDEKTKGNLVAAYIDLSRRQLDGKNYDDAIVYAEEAVKLNPTPNLKNQALDLAGSSYFSKATAETDPDVRNDYYDRAGETYAGILEMFPADTSALFNAGVSFLQMKDCGRSLPYLRKLAELTPKSKEALSILGRGTRECGEIDSSIVVLKRLLNVDPRDTKSHRYLASAYIVKGDKDLGAMHFVIATALTEGQMIPDVQERIKRLKNDYPKGSSILDAAKKYGVPEEIYGYVDPQTSVKVEVWFYWTKGTAQPFLAGRPGVSTSFAPLVWQ